MRRRHAKVKLKGGAKAKAASGVAMVVPRDCYLYQAATGQWVIGTAETLEAGVGCWCFVEGGGATTPNQVRGRAWYAHPHGLSTNASEFVRSPNLRVEPVCARHPGRCGPCVIA